MMRKLCSVALLAMLISVTACGGGGDQTPTGVAVQPAETPTESAQENTAAAPTTEAGTDDVWARIQAADKIVVGTSVDYPPFSYYPSFTYYGGGEQQIDGFDVALMRAIGQQLGLQVEFVDFAFDGLLGALQLGQIDVAIAAISVTPERQGVVGFSHIYYVGEDAALAHQDATITVRSIADIAVQKTAVQRGTVYETWVKTDLIDTSLMSPNNLFLYDHIRDAVGDLRAGKVGIVIMDYGPALSFVEQGGVKVVGHGLKPQPYAIAVLQGATILEAEINGALAQLYDAGQITQLAQEYLNLPEEEILPAPAPVPAAPATAPTPPCIDGLELVEDLTYDDQNMAAPPEVAGGESFVKGWRVRNTGTCPWDESYSFVYVRGNVPAASMSGEPVAVAGTVASGDTYDIQVNLVAPQTPGTYQGFWQMHDGQGVAFGQTIYVAITVP